MTNSEIKTASEATARELRAAGIKVQAYNRSPLGPNAIFSVALDRLNVLHIWNGEAQVTVVPGSTGLRQAVLQVHEKARTIKTEHQISWTTWQAYPTLEDLRAGKSYTRWIGNNFGVFLPDGATYSIESYERFTKGKLSPTGYEYWGIAVLVGKVKATRQHFLVGRDEKSQFISALPRQTTSVFDAHDALRPKGVPRTALRQGEWFFVPATSVEKTAIKRSIESRGAEGIHHQTNRGYGSYRNRVGELEAGSSHHAPALIITGNRRYAVGLVYDTRPGRHGQLILPDWHRVIRNRERVNPTIGGQTSARFD